MGKFCSCQMLSTTFMEVKNAVIFSVSVDIFLLSFALCSIRRQREAELKLLEEETARRVEIAIQKKVEESLNSEVIKLELKRRLEEGRKKLLDEVAAQLEKEKEAALIEARQKEVSILDLLYCTYLHQVLID